MDGPYILVLVNRTSRGVTVKRPSPRSILSPASNGSHRDAQIYADRQADRDTHTDRYRQIQRDRHRPRKSQRYRGKQRRGERIEKVSSTKAAGFPSAETCSITTMGFRAVTTRFFLFLLGSGLTLYQSPESVFVFLVSVCLSVSFCVCMFLSVCICLCLSVSFCHSYFSSPPFFFFLLSSFFPHPLILLPLSLSLSLLFS